MVGFSFTPCPECGEQVGYVLGEGDYLLKCSECKTLFDRRDDHEV